MSLWTKLRDAVESVAVVAGNYFLPGSSIITSKLVSDGSKEQLGSTVGQLAQLGSAGFGINAGNLSNYATAFDKVAAAAGGAFDSASAALGGTSQLTGQAAVDAFNAGTLSADEFATLAAGSGTTSQALLSGVGLSKYLMPAASIASSLIGANAAQQSAATQAEAQSQANKLQYGMFQEQKALQEPYRQAGLTAQNALMQKLGLGGDKTAADYGSANREFSMAGFDPNSLMKNFSASDFQQDPGYAFRLSEGLKGLDRSAAARGGLISGGALKAATQYGQEMGSQEYQNAFNRFQAGRATQGQEYGNAFNRFQTNRTNQLQPLGNLMSSGQSAASNQGAAAGAYGNAGAAGLTNIGAAQAAGQMGTANALSSGLSNYMNYSSNQNLANALRQSQSAYNQG